MKHAITMLFLPALLAIGTLKSMQSPRTHLQSPPADELSLKADDQSACVQTITCPSCKKTPFRGEDAFGLMTCYNCGYKFCSLCLQNWKSYNHACPPSKITTKPCPACKNAITKASSWNLLTCDRCGYKVCWLCWEKWEDTVHMCKGTTIPTCGLNSIEEGYPHSDGPCGWW